MKKIGIVFFMVVMSLIVAVPVSMAGDTSFEIGNTNVTANVGETFKLPVTFKSDVKVKAIGLSFKYDDTVLELTNFENQASFQNAPFATTYDVDKKLISIGWLTEQDFSREIKVCDVCFKVIGSGDIKIKGKPTVKDSTGKNDITTDSPEINVSARTKQFTGITFNDATYTYDQTTKSIAISGELPNGANVTYTSDGEEDRSLATVGTLNVTAKITCVGYDELKLSAKLKIEPKEITANVSAQDKIYDGTTDAIISESSLVGVFTGDDVSANLPTAGTFANKNAGKDILVSVDEIKLSGTDKNNYKIIQPSNIKADINKKSLKIATTDVEVTYGEAINPTVTYSGFITGEDEKILTKDVVISGYDSKPDAGEYDIILSGAEATNYDISYTNAKLKVNKKGLTITELKVFDKEADGTATAKVNTSSLKVSGILEDDDVSVNFSNVTATFESIEIGNNIDVNIEGLTLAGTDAKNYDLPTTFTAKASIKERITAAEIVEQIELDKSSIDSENNKIELPTVPNGYKITISSSSNENVIDLDGSVAPVETETTVKLKYTIERNDDETDVFETNEITVTIPATEKIKVTLKAQTNGTVSGDGEYFKNSSVTVSAVPNDGYVFSGWYNGNNLVSRDENYIFKAKSNIELTAKFTRKNTSTGGAGGGSITTTTYTIEVVQNENGKISPDTIKVKKGENQKFEIKADDGYKILEVLVDGKSVNVVTEYTFNNLNADHTIEAIFAKIEDKEEIWQNPFMDVRENDWFFDAVKFANQNKLLNGMSNSEFGPDVSMTRAMLVTILYRLENEPGVNKSKAFSDVNASDYYASAVAWAWQNNIVLGTNENEFAPNIQITREQVATIFYRYAEYKKYDITVGEDTNILSYKDFSEISEYAIAPMQYMVGAGLIKGKTESTLNPKDFVTRAEIATILQRFIEKNEVKN